MTKNKFTPKLFQPLILIKIAQFDFYVKKATKLKKRERESKIYYKIK